MPPPSVIRTTAAWLDGDPAVTNLVSELREASDACVFLSGGAGHMGPEHRDRVRETLAAIALLHHSGLRVMAADGGTHAGVMELLGDVRATANPPFPLLGIVPAPEVPPLGCTPLDPHHSHILAVTDEQWDATRGWWGSETATMFALFERLAHDRPSIAVLANGGFVSLAEVDRHVHTGRPVIVLAGSGRAADALASRLGYAEAADTPPPDARLADEVQRRHLATAAPLFSIVPVDDGPEALAYALAAQLKKSAF